VRWVRGGSIAPSEVNAFGQGFLNWALTRRGPLRPLRAPSRGIVRLLKFWLCVGVFSPLLECPLGFRPARPGGAMAAAAAALVWVAMGGLCGLSAAGPCVLVRPSHRARFWIWGLGVSRCTGHGSAQGCGTGTLAGAPWRGFWEDIPIAAPVCGFWIAGAGGCSHRIPRVGQRGAFHCCSRGGAKTTHWWLRALSRSVSLPAHRGRVCRRPLASCA
jgi:hypothetical protein